MASASNEAPRGLGQLGCEEGVPPSPQKEGSGEQA